MSMALKYGMKKRMAGYQSPCPGDCNPVCEVHMAEGGGVKGVHEHNYEGKGNSPAGSFAKSAVSGNTSIPKHELNSYAKNEHKRVLGELRSMPKPKLAEGGVIDRIMAKKGYSNGGDVANDDEAFEAEFSEPNQFDELVKDDVLEFHDTGANSGDELGDAQESEDRKDMVAKIMASRKKKDRNPRPA